MHGRRFTTFGFGLALAAGSTQAGVVIYRLGEQDFADQSGPIMVAEARSAGSNEAAPFDGTVYGDDRTSRFGKIHFTYNVMHGELAGDGQLTLGLIGLDSPPGRGSTVKLILDGQEQPNDAFAGVSSAAFRSSASVVDTVVPSWMLADGKLDVTIKAFRRGPGYPGNAIEADFSTLTVNVMDAGPGSGLPGGTPPDGSTDPGSTPGGPDPDNPGGDPGGGGIPTPIPGGTGGQPLPPAVPLPPAAYAGAVGLALAWWRRPKMLPNNR